MQQSDPYLSFRGIGKTFPGVNALTDISFDCYAGRVHALMGENGAGKSTLLKILSGNYTPTTGTLAIRGEEVAFDDTTAALNAGVAIIYQELHLIPEMTVAENIYRASFRIKAAWSTARCSTMKRACSSGTLGWMSIRKRPLSISPSASGRWWKLPKRWRVTPRSSLLTSQPARSRRVKLKTSFA